MIDSDGYRPNVGIILCNDDGKLFWGRRVGQETWQFPQGGIKAHESPLDAMYRELAEEVGLACEDVEVMAKTRGWLRYRLPERFIRRHSKPICIGQKQIWFILRLLADERNVRFDLTDHPEFDGWRWVDYWRPTREVVHFKRGVYIRVLREFAPLLGHQVQDSASNRRHDKR